MKRSDVDYVKFEARRLLQRIDELERMAGWYRYADGEDKSTSKPHPDDFFRPGQYTAAVRRARLDLAKALPRIR